MSSQRPTNKRNKTAKIAVSKSVKPVIKMLKKSQEETPANTNAAPVANKGAANTLKKKAAVKPATPKTAAKKAPAKKQPFKSTAPKMAATVKAPLTMATKTNEKIQAIPDMMKNMYSWNKDNFNVFGKIDMMPDFSKLYNFQTPNFKETPMTNPKNFEKMAQDTANWNKDAAEACQKSMSIYAKGVQDCLGMYTDMLQRIAEQQNKMFKDLLGKKTMNEVSDAVQAASQENFNQIMSNFSKLSEQSVKVAMECFEPINDQINKSMKKSMAA